MKRLRRWLWNGAAGVSLLVFVLTLALWARSRWRHDWLYVEHEAFLVECGSDRGALFVRASPTPSGGARVPTLRLVSGAGGGSGIVSLGLDRGLGFGWRRMVLPPSVRTRAVGPPVTLRSILVPLWFVALVSGMAPVGWGLWRRASWKGIGCCPGGGYDLRCTPGGVGCPECGAARAVTNGN